MNKVFLTIAISIISATATAKEHKEFHGYPYQLTKNECLTARHPNGITTRYSKDVCHERRSLPMFVIGIYLSESKMSRETREHYLKVRKEIIEAERLEGLR
jgi:hypothetical protein